MDINRKKKGSFKIESLWMPTLGAIRGFFISFSSMLNVLLYLMFIIIWMLLHTNTNDVALFIANIYDSWHLSSIFNLKAYSPFKIVVVVVVFTVISCLINLLCKFIKHTRWRYFPYVHLGTATIGILIIYVLPLASRRLESFGFFKYDLLLTVLFLGWLFYSLLSKFIKTIKGTESSSKVSHFLEEAPISSIGKDYIDYNLYIKQLVEAITTRADVNMIGLLGSNGIGKTSVCKLVKTDVEKTGWLIINFNTIHYQNEVEMVRKLIDDIDYMMTTYSPVPELKKLDKMIFNYLSISNSGNSLVAKLLKMLLPRDTNGVSSTKLSELASLIRKSELKIVIFIDDVDRCSVAGKYNIFKALTIFEKIPQLKFVISSTVDDIFKENEPHLISLVQ